MSSLGHPGVPDEIVAATHWGHYTDNSTPFQKTVVWATDEPQDTDLNDEDDGALEPAEPDSHADDQDEDEGPEGTPG